MHVCMYARTYAASIHGHSARRSIAAVFCRGWLKLGSCFSLRLIRVGNPLTDDIFCLSCTLQRPFPFLASSTTSQPEGGKRRRRSVPLSIHAVLSALRFLSGGGSCMVRSTEGRISWPPSALGITSLRARACRRGWCRSCCSSLAHHWDAYDLCGRGPYGSSQCWQWQSPALLNSASST